MTVYGYHFEQMDSRMPMDIGLSIADANLTDASLQIQSRYRHAYLFSLFCLIGSMMGLDRLRVACFRQSDFVHIRSRSLDPGLICRQY
jgi:hypothetical protein